MSNSIITDLNWRHTCKWYDPNKKVSEADLKVIEEALQLSASSINSQPWRFVIVESDKAKKRAEKAFVDMFAFNQRHVFDSSHLILFGYNPRYNKADYAKVIDEDVKVGRIAEDQRAQAMAATSFIDLNTDENGYNGVWTKAQTYIALGNLMHVLARMKIDSTPMEGIVADIVSEEFKKELDSYFCELAVAIGYRSDKDYNENLPKSRLPLSDILVRA